MRRVIAAAAVFLLVQALNYLLLEHRVEPVMYQFYLIAWWSYIICLDVALSKQGRLVVNRGLPWLIVLSSGFWCLFELMNVRLQNWFYINVPSFTPLRYAGYLLAFGTVIPGIVLTKEAVSRLLPPLAARPMHIRGYTRLAVTAGALMLALVLLFPRYTFPLAWLFLIPLTDGVNYARRSPSFMGDLERGQPGRLAATLIAGLVCGLLWEGWNYWAVVKWIYTVPFFEEWKVFEMPLPGYLGFPVFAVEVVSFLDFIHHSRLFGAHRLRTAAIAIVFSVAVFPLIDRHTVFSRAAYVESLSFIAASARQELRASGVMTSHAIDARRLAPQEQRILELVHLKGLGSNAAERLAAHGVRDVASLACMTERTLGEVIREDNPRRLRVFLKAARSRPNAGEPCLPPLARPSY